MDQINNNQWINSLTAKFLCFARTTNYTNPAYGYRYYENILVTLRIYVMIHLCVCSDDWRHIIHFLSWVELVKYHHYLNG